MTIKEVTAKSILNPSKIHDYCLNPYVGCSHRCVYCYARLFMCRYTGHKEPWGSFVDVKVNAVELLRRQLPKAKPGTIWISSVSDPYQPVEDDYQLTRQLLNEIKGYSFPVEIQTKSPLVVRDLDILVKLEKIAVGMTVTTDNQKIADLFEPGAAPIEARLAALEKLHDAGITTFAFIGPILPGNAENLSRLLAGKVDSVLIDRMNYIFTLKNFYVRHGLRREAEDDYFREKAIVLKKYFSNSGIPVSILF